MRLGESRTRAIDVRIITATNRDLTRESAEQRFRPDLLYRMRTALSDVGTENPAEVMVSCKTGWQSGGAIPHPGGGDAFVPYGTHGGANVDGIGVIISEERDLPGAVRADAFLDLFPHAAEHLRERGIAMRPADPDAVRPHR